MSEWLERIEAAAKDVFESMLGVQVRRTDAGSRNGLPDLTALVSLTGNPEGVLEIACYSASAARIAMLMLGSNSPESNETAKDALGEFCTWWPAHQVTGVYFRRPLPALCAYRRERQGLLASHR